MLTSFAFGLALRWRCYVKVRVESIVSQILVDLIIYLLQAFF